MTAYTCDIGGARSYAGRRLSAAMSSGGAPVRLLMFGHSHVAGAGAGTGPDGIIDCARSGVSEKIIDYLSGYGIVARKTGWYGDYNAGLPSAGSMLFDNRISVESGWASDTSPNFSLGGKLIFSSPNSGKLTITPGYEFIAADVVYPTLDILSASIEIYGDGVFVESYSQNASSGLARHRVTFQSPVSSISIRNASASASGCISGIELIPADHTDIAISVAGCCAATTGNLLYSTYPWSSINGFCEFSADIAVVYAMTNDIMSPTSRQSIEDAFNQNIDTITNYSMCRGNTVIVIDPPGNAPNFLNGIYDDFAVSAHGVAHRHGATVCDMRSAMSRIWSNLSRDGLAFNDVHLNSHGQSIEAEMLTRHIVEKYFSA